MEMFEGGPFGAGGGVGAGGGATGGAAAGAIPNCPKLPACGLRADVGVCGTAICGWGTNMLGACAGSMSSGRAHCCKTTEAWAHDMNESLGFKPVGGRRGVGEGRRAFGLMRGGAKGISPRRWSGLKQRQQAQHKGCHDVGGGDGPEAVA